MRGIRLGYFIHMAYSVVVELSSRLQLNPLIHSRVHGVLVQLGACSRELRNKADSPRGLTDRCESSCASSSATWPGSIKAQHI